MARLSEQASFADLLIAHWEHGQLNLVIQSVLRALQTSLLSIDTAWPAVTCIFFWLRAQVPMLTSPPDSPEKGAGVGAIEISSAPVDGLPTKVRAQSI